ncbi:MAG: glycosyltransferase [Bacteroidaceae bacterium]|nr:glycosyltransferase [Bacteroidaceae bacterium]
MSKPTFSIITVTYNAEVTLERTLQSVAAQTYPYKEYILKDGASTDGTMALAERYAALFSHCISKPDHGLYDAMNQAMLCAKGDYLIFLNAGDCFHSPHTLEDMVASIEKDFKKQGRVEVDKWPDILYGQTILVDAQGQFVGNRHYTAPAELSWRSFQKGMLVCHQAFWAKRSFLLSYNLSYRFSSDFDWCIRNLKQASSCFYSPEVLIDYLDEGLTTRNHKASLKERFRIMIQHYGFCKAIWAHIKFAARALKSGAQA